MAEYTSTIQFKGKGIKVIVVLLVVALAAFGIYAHATGKNLHIRTGVINGTGGLKVTEYLDNQDDIQGKVSTTVPIAGGGSYILLGAGVAIDTSPVTQSQNRQYPVDHYIKGTIKNGVLIHGLVRKTNTTPEIQNYGINELYEVPPYDPFYLTVE